MSRWFFFFMGLVLVEDTNLFWGKFQIKEGLDSIIIIDLYSHFPLSIRLPFLY